MSKAKVVSFAAVTSLLVGLFIMPRNVLASVRCETQYGGGQVCVRTGQVQVNKKVWNADTSSWVDNMGLSDHVFVAGEEVTFRVQVKNVGDQTLSQVYVSDVLPNYVYLTTDKHLTIEIRGYAPQQTKT